MNDMFETWEGGEPEVFGRRQKVDVPTMGSLRLRVPSARHPRAPRRPGRFAPVPFAHPVPYPDAEPSPADGSASEEARWVQDCLNRVLNLQLPVSGHFDAATRSAIRSFQRRQGLAATGIASPSTRRRLDAACEGGEAETAPTSEWEDASEGEEEFKFSAPYGVKLTAGSGPVRISNRKSLEQLPTRPGVYFLHVGGTIWYVGKAGDSIRARLSDRFKTFHDFKISERDYRPWTSRVHVTWYLVEAVGRPDARGIFRRKGSGGWQRIGKQAGLLGAVEQHFISTLKTQGAAQGNQTSEALCQAGNGAVTLYFSDGRAAQAIQMSTCKS